jgi:uncharacterized protein YcbX
MSATSASGPQLVRITIYPIKSLDGILVDQATLLPRGPLEHDRRYALRDSAGRLLNGKRTEAMHRLRLDMELASGVVALTAGDERGGGEPRRFHIDTDRAELAQWLQDYFALEQPLEIIENAATGFPEDEEAPGPTVVSTATLETAASWFPGLKLEEMRRRFRANLEIGGVEPFWEDRLYGEAGQAVRFQLGELLLDGVNPCQRCVVPSRDSVTGAVTSQFAQRFAERRRQCLPPWAAISRFDHFYRLAVNTRPVDSTGGCIRLGDPVRILGTLPK